MPIESCYLDGVTECSNDCLQCKLQELKFRRDWLKGGNMANFSQIMTHNFMKDGFNFDKKKGDGTNMAVTKDTVVIGLELGKSKVMEITDPAQKAVMMGVMDANGTTTIEQISKTTSVPIPLVSKAASVLQGMQYVKLINS